MKVYGLALPGAKIAGRFDGEVFRKNEKARRIEIKWKEQRNGGPDPKAHAWMIKQGRTEYSEEEFKAAKPVLFQSNSLSTISKLNFLT